MLMFFYICFDIRETDKLVVRFKNIVWNGDVTSYFNFLSEDITFNGELCFRGAGSNTNITTARYCQARLQSSRLLTRLKIYIPGCRILSGRTSPNVHVFHISAWVVSSNIIPRTSPGNRNVIIPPDQPFKTDISPDMEKI